MRVICAALVMMLPFAVTASAQDGPKPVNPDDVVARLMQFDRNSDFKIAIDELPDRMQTLVVRGDKSDDLMLDAKEIRRMTTIGPEMPALRSTPQFGSYGFGDVFSLSTRTHIGNSIDDLRLPPQTAAEAKRIAFEQADEFERSSRAGTQQLTEARRAILVARLSSVLTDEERDNLNAALARRPIVKNSGTQAFGTLGIVKLKQPELLVTPVVR